ncbi:hypothetical protein [Cohnella terricola]|uniref:Uncharacterized protein n=1 Tax=Cohnella terricola TaxID=1289167 RepID=A0A559JR66_9BACL|nr:hypothetical protein [Cohnella terricola]TVY02363.1 hypothetical protein FPZ45_08020 [Cohnella terricola]
MDEKELFEQLRSGPLSRNGFDDALRRKINENLDHPRRGLRRPPFLRFGMIGASFVLAVAVVAGVWSWRGTVGEEADKSTLPTEQASATASATNEREINPIPHSAVVIGLRKDDAQGTRSTYRTVVVAPENNQLQLIGTGPGIWMPYKQNFWHIEATEDPMGKGDQRLVARKSGKKKENEGELTEPAMLRKTEKLLYAGDHYVTILQTTNVNDNGKPVEASRVLTNLLPTISFENRVRNANAVEEGNVTLAEALKTGDSGLAYDQWAVVRENNEWVAKENGPIKGKFDARDIYDWPTVNVRFANTDIVKDNPPVLSEADIKRIEPDAIDAFTSQDEDIALFVTRSSLKVLSYQLPENERQSVVVGIEPGESVVMVQWAIQENYVKNWINWSRGWFAPSAK